MAENLVIVESPAKSQTIKKFLGPDFEVKASFGHVVDLPQKSLGIDIENNFQPQYEVSPDKKRVISELKSLAKNAKKVWIATDEDREGEAIGRHVANQLGLDIKKTARIVFHEITKNAIQHAVENPRTLDMHLVDAQQARRVLDRLVGFELSPVLRRKIKAGLSAGRVQSVAVRLIVEREREIQKFQSESSFKVVGFFVGEVKQSFKAELSKEFKTQEEAQNFLEEIKSALYNISDIEVKPGKKSPSAPFTTSTLQQEASRKMGFPVARTMQVAQKLYEAGLITYMRTDSVNLSETAVNACQQEITKLYGKEYSNPTYYKTKSKGSQEAHECIRPTHMENSMAGDDPQQKKLYDLIRKRTLASQMAPAVVEKTKATIDISSSKLKFIATGEVIKFEGFLKVYLEGRDDEDEQNQEGMLPILKEGENLISESILAGEKFKKHPPRYTEASLVKKLEELGIGRPSTYAPTISTVQKRGYVVKEDRTGEQRSFVEMTLKNGEITTETKTQITGAEKQKLFPTDVGMVVTDFLVEHFGDIMDYSFTATVEEDFDKIAENQLQRQDMMLNFYGSFHASVVDTLGTAERQSGERDLGIDPVSGRKVIARIGRFGPMVQIGHQDEEEKPKFSSLPAGKNIETVTLEEALKMFALPRVVGNYDGQEMTSAIGKFGPYIKWGSTYASIPRDAEYDVFTITSEQAENLVKAKVEQVKNRNINIFDYEGKQIEVLRGQYGPYIKYNKNNFKIPKGGKDATDLTLQDCIAIIGPKALGSETPTKTTKPKKKSPAKKASPKKKK
ncbi:MAG: type I DNA topoisomerase [Candidatus Absconditabacteria bacterium]|nr:type I DNA topoisomerase [Candidatus Absconditabacteria bacterium]